MKFIVIAILATSMRLGAQSNLTPPSSEPRYSVTRLGTFGGTQSTAYGINNRRWVVGEANLPGDENERGFLWRDGTMSELVAWSGPNGGVGPLSLRNDGGIVPGYGQTTTPDPLNENWNYTCTISGTTCEGTDLITRGLVWTAGSRILLPTLGGNQSEAEGINNHGLVVGIAETANEDANCAAPQILDYEAVIWKPADWSIQMLPPVSGDSIGAALSINDLGQIVGASGQCGPVSTASASHAVLWQSGTPSDLGSLGGKFGNVAYSINNRGQVVGMSDLAGDTTAHAFLWQNGTIRDLGTLPGDYFSQAASINDQGQVVGQSCDQNGNCRAFLWQNGIMMDLNTLVPPGSLYLLSANALNDVGEVVGQGYDPVTGDAPGFIASPRSGDDAVRDTITTEEIQTRTITLPHRIREHLQQRLRLGPNGKGCEFDTRGLLQRAHITANWPPIYIGKESDRHWEEGEDLSLLEFKTIEYKRKGYAIATEKQLEQISRVPKRELRRRGINQHTLEKICERQPVRAIKLAECLSVLPNSF